MRTLLTRFKDIHKGETAVVIGNGLSLKLSDLDSLKYPTFGSNRIYRLPFTPTYYAMVDREMIDTCLPLPEWFKPKEMFVRAEYGVGNPIYPIVAGGFSKNIDNFVITGGTVTYVLFQLAYYMGFTTLLLLGVDHSYPMASQIRPGQSFTGGETDPDHFSCSDGRPYFETGKTYNAPELERVAQYYAWADEFFKLEGRKIINLTPGTRLECFEKSSIENWT